MRDTHAAKSRRKGHTMSAQRSTLFGQRRDPKKRDGGLSYAEFLNLYGGLLDDLEPLVLELAKSGTILGSGHPKDLESEVSPEFATRVAAFQQKIKDSVEKEHMGGFDGNVKKVVAETYGPTSDLAQKYGDQEENAICLALPSQAKKVSAVKLVAEFLGIQAPPATKTAVAKLLEAARVKIQVAEGERAKSRETTRPTRNEDEKQSDFLKRVNLASKTSEFGEVKGAVSWLTNWVEGKKPTTQASGQQDAPEPPKDKKTEIREKITELEGKRTTHQTSAQTALASGNTPAAMASMKQMEEVESELTATKAELETIEAGERENTRLKAAATVVALAPPKPGEATGTIGGITVVDTKSAIEDIKVPETLEETIAEIARLVKEFELGMDASARHYIEAKALYAAADEVRKTNRPKAGKMDVEAGELETRGAKAKQASEKIKERIDALQAKKVKLEAATKKATPPAAEPKQRRVRLAGRKPAEPVVAAQSAVTTDGSKPIDKIALLKAINVAADKLGEVTVKNFRDRISSGKAEEIVSVKAEFEAMTS